MSAAGDNPKAAAVRLAMGEHDTEKLDELLSRGATLEALPIELLNDLLVYPGHHEHQQVAFELQTRADRSTTPFIRAVLDSGFEFLDYTASEDGVIAKWLSWVLAEIGTPEAIGVLREFSRSPNTQVAEQMTYRLRRLRER